MSVKLESTKVVNWTTQDPATGSSADASAQTVTILEDGTAMGYAPSITNPSTGEYSIAIACTTANGFEAGKGYQVKVSATVGGVAGKAIVSDFEVESKAISDLAQPSDVPSAATNAAAVRTNLATELGRIDAATSTRPTLAQIEASTVLAKTSDVPSAATTAAAVRTNLATELAQVSAVDARLPADPADQSAVEAAISAIPAAPTTASILAAMNATPPAVNIKVVNDIPVAGVGTELNPWGPA